MPNLQSSFVKRETFDPTNQVHLASLDFFIRTGNWGDVQFYVELPYNEVPMTVLMKYVQYSRGLDRETEVERQERFATLSKLVRPTQAESISVQRKKRLEQAAISSKKVLEWARGVPSPESI